MNKPTKPKEETTFNARVRLDITQVKGDVHTSFFDTEVVYHALPRAGMLTVEAVLLQALKQLHGVGVAQAGDQKLSAMLKQMGL